MDIDDLDPKKNTPSPKNLEEMSIESLGEYIAELESEIARASQTIKMKQDALAGAESIFKK